MEPAKNFTDLIVWQKAHLFVLAAYKYSSNFPKEEIYALTSQFRRAAVSIAANIAEGFKKKSNKDKIRYYNISQGSVEECRYYLILAKDLRYGENIQLANQIEEVSKILDAYIKSIESNSANKLLSAES
jgi:four helix bundle protein